MQKLFKIVSNKYFITFMIFLVWMIFFDNNNIIRQFRIHSSLTELEKKKEFYLEEIEKNRQARIELTTNTHNLEKFAREKHLMKRDNEDIYLIIESAE